MISSSAGTTVSLTNGWYCAASCFARAADAGRSCSPSTLRAALPGVP
ncbi:hypothetical protein [Pseudonocardia sp. 73-21]|nr:hypothetical protein [Pseudonocardia sp. 73-21]